MSEPTLYRFMAIVRYELLWNVRKKKVLGILVLVFSLATLSLALPVVLSNVYNVTLSPEPDHVINAGAFLGEVGFFLVAVVVSMNSVSGEFESGTIVPLLSKPVSRTTIFVGKLCAALVTLSAAYALLFLYLAVGGTVVFGPQNNLGLVPVLFAGSIASTFVWVAIVMAIGSASKSSLTAALGAFGIWLGLGLVTGIYGAFSGERWILTYIPGGGATGYIAQASGGPFSGPAVRTGIASIADNLVTLVLHPSTVVNFPQVDILAGVTRASAQFYTESISYVVTLSVVVAAVYIVAFSLVGWFALKRAQIKE